jgi:hypothetical protein
MNQLVLAIFAPVLILVGILGFVVPPQRALTSGAPAYNVFHLIFGLVGGVIALTGNDSAIGAFLIGFGLIDLYQAVASRRDLFPKTWFRWRPADDVLHVVVGAALVVVGAIGIITN